MDSAGAGGTRRFEFPLLLERLDDPRPRRGAAIETADGTVSAVRSMDQPPADNGRLATPALVNAHDHGYGLRPLDFGVADDALEAFIAGWGMRPVTDPYLEALVAFGRMARSGIGTTMHLINSHRVSQLQGEAEHIARAAGDIGIRVALSCPLLDRGDWVYDGPEAVEVLLADQDRERMRAALAKRPPMKEQIANANEVADSLSSPMVSVLYGPVGPQWCTNESLERIAEASAQNQRYVHMHTLESMRQREWLDRAHPMGFMRFLDQIGLLSERLSLAHGVQLRDEEIELLAERGVTVVSNPSSNLRYRSGVAPLARMRAAGMRVALGLDGAGIDDDQDMWREIRLAHLLHGGKELDAAIPQGWFLQAATTAAVQSIGMDSGLGAISEGAPADFVTIDFARLAADSVYPPADLRPWLLQRMTSAYVDGLVVAGEPVLKGGKALGVDLPAAEKEFAGQCRAGALGEEHAAWIGRMRSAVQTHYGGD